jgi:hypothetical protein
MRMRQSIDVIQHFGNTLFQESVLRGMFTVENNKNQMFMKSAVVFFVVVSTLASYGQTTIKGVVRNSAGEPVPFANLFLKNTYDGSSASDDGTFHFTSDETGVQTLVIKALGYKELQKQVTLNDEEEINLSIALTEEINELNAVTISAGSFTASDESRRTVFRAIDIATTAGATADIAGALNTLPGTQKVGESGRLFVRGGDGNETKTFIDGLLVLDAYSPSAPNTPSRGRFLPFMFKGTSFSTGGYSSEYGQALSSALALESKDESEITRTDFGLLSVGGDVTHTQAWKGGSAAGKIQYTNLRPYTKLISQRIDWMEAPTSLEGITAFRQKVGDHGMFKVYGNFTDSDMALHNHDIDDYQVSQLYQLKNKYRYANASYKDLLNENWVIRGGGSYTIQNNHVKLEDTKIMENEKGLHLKTVVEGSISDRIELKTGGEVISRNHGYEANGLPSASNATFTETLSAFFAETDLYASNNFVTRLGGRMEHNSLTNELSADPRISLAYKTGSIGQVSFAYGKFRQSIKNEYLRFSPGLAAEKAEHFILNYQRIENNRTFRVETYYKKYNDLLKIVGNNSYNNAGSGYAKGVELFWRDNESVDRLDYWVSYSFLDTQRDYLNFPNQATPSFASKHNFSIVGKYFIKDLKSQLGATWSYTSGRPYNDPNEEIFNASRTRSYQDLSFNWSYLPKPYLIVYVSCTNVLGRENVFGYEFSTVRNDQGFYNSRAIRQPAPRFLFLGIFLTLTEDKTVNQLPVL